MNSGATEARKPQTVDTTSTYVVTRAELCKALGINTARVQENAISVTLDGRDGIVVVVKKTEKDQA